MKNKSIRIIPNKNLKQRELLLKKRREKRLFKLLFKLNNKRRIIENIILRILVSLANIIILIINIYFLCEKTSNIKKFNEKLKSSDQFVFSLLTKSYTEFLNYLNNKFNSNTLVQQNKKKVIRLYAVNLFNPNFFKRYLLWFLKDKFIIQFTKDNPDYFVYNTFGHNENNPLYKNCIKIAILTENYMPDLYNCDYAFGHFHISYLDRFFTIPFAFLHAYNKTKHIHLTEIRNNVTKYPRKKFCAALFTGLLPHVRAESFRLKFVDKLNKSI